jgi:hypothetical protein
MTSEFDQLIAVAAGHASSGEHNKALKAIAAACSLQPLNFSVHTNAGMQLAAMGEFEEAANAYRRALMINQMHSPTWSKLAWVLMRPQKFAESLACARMALTLSPTDQEAMMVSAMILGMFELDADAIPFLRKCIIRDPSRTDLHYPSAEMALGVALLRLGQWGEGWQMVESRWQLRPHGAPADWTPRKPWTGTPDEMRGKRIGLYAEQGYGDTLHFIRYVPLVQELAASVVVVCPPPLVRLVQTMGITCVPDLVLEDIDIRTGIMSLPKIFGSRPDFVPTPAKFVVEPIPQPARVGICWHGDARPHDPGANADDMRRSISWELFGPLAGVVPVISLQKEDLPPGDWLDTARIVAGLDLVITVDTAMCHLAASLGVETWMLARRGGCWRWLLNTDRTAWYPNMRIFREPVLSNWGPCVNQVVDALKLWAAEHA